MKIVLPKEMRGTTFSQALSLDLNGFDVDHFLPTFFFKVLADGLQAGQRPNDPEAIGKYISKLVSHPDIRIEEPDRYKTLERLVRTELIEVGTVGQQRRGEQIITVTPYTILSHKVGLPKASSRQRGVDSFLYQAMLHACGGIDFPAREMLKEYLKRVFAKGVIINPPPQLGGYYDGTTALDTMTRLSLAFLDGFEDTPVGRKESRKLPDSACPVLARTLGEDLLCYLFAYSSKMPTQALTYNFQALISFELFVYTLKHVTALNQLVQRPEILPKAMCNDIEPSPPDIYLDFTNEPHSLSQEMARSCVRRDIESYQRYLGTILLLRLLDGYVGKFKRTKPKEIEAALDGAASGPHYLQGLLKLLHHPQFEGLFETRAQDDEDKILDATKAAISSGAKGNKSADDADDSDSNTNPRAYFDEIAQGATTNIERVAKLLTKAQQQEGLRHYAAWFWGVGGLTKPYGILAGTLKGRKSWHYAPSNDLLAMLVQLATVAVPSEGGAKMPAAQQRINPKEQKAEPVRLQEFLDYLYTRFGILIDRPPAPYSGAEAASAARDNLRAMLGRLRQMGVFSDLSDDFTVQELRPPYTGA
jgi:hypothetical protein